MSPTGSTFTLPGGLNALAVSLIVAAFVWHAPPVPMADVSVDPALPWNVLAQTYVDDRRITLNADWPTWKPEYLCTVIVHEVGHLEGHDHSTDPGNVMYPIMLNYYAPCAQAMEPHRRHPAGSRDRRPHARKRFVISAAIRSNARN